MDVSTVRPRGEPEAGRRVRVAVDAMGGDHAPGEVVEGSLGWALEHPETDILLVGDSTIVERLLAGRRAANIEVVHASESVEMEEHPAAAVRRKRDASINICMRLVRDGRADAVMTGGHTGAGVAAAILGLGRLPGVDRPALAVQMVTDKGPFVLLDIGATTDSTGHNLAQYARMGAIFSEQVFGVPDPSVALLSIGEEGGKGEARVQEATRQIAASDLNFVGNVEGKDLVHHLADVVVCDASVGNVTMKFFEGLSSFIFDALRTEFRRPPWGPIGYLFMRSGISRLRARFDYEKLGGAPLLGVKGTVLITHGRAKRRMIGYAVGVAAVAAGADIPTRIEEALRRDEAAIDAADGAKTDGSGAPGAAGTGPVVPSDRRPGDPTATEVEA